MARLPYLDKEDLPLEYQDLLNQGINLNRVLVNSPDCRRASLAMAQYFRGGSTVDARLRELAILQVGYLSRAPYEWCHHIHMGRTVGVTDKDIRELIRSAEGLPADLDRPAVAVLAMAREITLMGEVSDDTFAALTRYFDNAQIVDLITVTAYYNGVVRILASLQVEVEEELLPYLDEFPLPAE